MKVKYLIVVGLLLAILTIGAASASQDADALAVNDDAGDAVSQADDMEVIAGDDSGGGPEDERNETDNYVYIPEDVGVDDDESSINVDIYESGITGNVTVKIINDDETETVIYNDEVIPATWGHWDDTGETWIDSTGGNSIFIKDLNLDFGRYNMSVSYTGDDNYKPFVKYGTMNYHFMKAYINDEITYGSFPIYIENSVNGTIEVFIDNDSFCNISTDYFENDGEGLRYDVGLSSLKYATHTYKITFTGNYELKKPFEGKFNLSYPFSVSYDFDYLYPDSNATFMINYPYGADGEVMITYNGRTVTKRIIANESDEEYRASVVLSGFALGDNEINFTYTDSKLPDKSVVIHVDVRPRMTVYYTMRYANEEDAISIALPSDATGNLVISLKKWNETLGKYEYELIASVPLLNGSASHVLTELGMGYHDISVVYDGDDYKDWFDENEPCIEIIPDIVYDQNVYANATNTINVVLPGNGSDNLTVTVRSITGHFVDESYEQYVCDYEEEIYNAVANGTVTVTLPQLAVGQYYIDVKYGGSVSNYHSLVVRGTSPDLNLDIEFPSEITSNNRTVIINGVPDDINGHLELYIDGELYEGDMYLFADEVESSEGDGGKIHNRYYLYYEEYGTHTWEIRFVGDEYYRDTSRNGTFFIDWIEIPQIIYNGRNIHVSLEDKKGYIELKIDGKAYASEFLEDGYASIEIDGLSMGTHTYEINYYDMNNVKNLTKSGSFTTDYGLWTDIDTDSTYPLTKEFKLHVDLPGDATGTVTVKVNGKTYTATPIEGVATIIIDNLVLGENNVTTSYLGDEKYPAKEITEVIKTEHGIFVNYIDAEEGIFDYVSIYLPADADGNLTLYGAVWIDGYDDIDGEGFDIYVPGHWQIVEDSPVMSVKLVDGFAKISVSEFAYGSYDLFARYVSENSDYEVRGVGFHFDVTPEVNITETIVVGENATITVVIKNATGVINVYMKVGYDEVACEPIFDLFAEISSDNGTFTKEISGLKLGVYDFYLKYVGDDMDNMFNSHRIYSISVEPKAAEIPEMFNSDGSGEIALELPEGSKGNVSVYEIVGHNETTDQDILRPIIENATYTSENKSIAVSGLETGSHNLKVVYRDDENGEIVMQATVNVPKPDAGKDVVIPNTVSGDSFEINLPKDATGSLLVTVDGVSQVVPITNGKAKIDMSGLADGTHTVTVKYPDGDNYTGFEKSFNITVKKAVEPRITASDLAILYTAGTKYSVTVYGTDGKLAANTKVTFLVNGKAYKSATTNSKGVASVAITQKPGTYKITAKALGKQVTKTLKVKHIVSLPKVKVKRSAKKLIIKVKVAKVNGKYVTGKVVLKFKNKKYTAKVKKGVAKFTIKKNVLKKLKKGKKVTYTATYKQDTVKRTVKVLK